ncbi:RNA ligase-domain-containing protein [Ephemerocybe angulata]|uniref:RNA ligase-domain-containing protein n=1 Tax=Ephemerocybe angulata TaxID=980116 RepID=A0A8H6H9G3_9AGAR|nr:RNA ligase-domain-containing protein [Tulosesus angulatus]
MSSRTFTFLSLNTLLFRFRPNSIDLRIRTPLKANRITQGQGSVRPPSFSTMSSSIPQTPAQTIAQALDDSHLIDSLITLSRKSPKLVRSTEAAVPGCESISVCSWKMNEFKYHDIPLPFPTLARGLFTTEQGEARRESEGDRDVRHRIVVRGYDKFFNIGEVPWTTWEAIERHTCAPYVLSLKSNGCIIFIAAVTPEKLVVTSKHSLGNADEVLGPKGNGKAPVSHAGVGRRWLGRYLEAKGRTEADLARVLWDNRWTAVAELCDDSFEEHVLPYPPSKTGLHLHGLNVSSGPFETLSHSVVDAFAEDWGFIRTATITLSSIGKVREFTSKISETGKWNGEAVEGFVVRTHVSTPPTETKKNKTISRDQSPYTHGSDFFFKIKFDEPYMWREVTKTLLSVRDKQGVSKMGLSVRTRCCELMVAVFHSPPSSIIGPDAQQDHRSTARRGRRAYATDYGQVHYGVLRERGESRRRHQQQGHLRGTAPPRASERRGGDDDCVRKGSSEAHGYIRFGTSSRGRGS